MVVKFEKKTPTQKEIDALHVKEWGLWDSPEPPGFDWEYDEKEVFYVLEGVAEIVSGKDKLAFKVGDLVTIYPACGKCRWNVTKKIKKHYKFGN